MALDFQVIGSPILHVGFVSPQILNQPRAVTVPLLAFDSRFVPIVGLRGDENADDDDCEVNSNREPVLRSDMLADAADDHLRPL
jgi:hypothetical protein